MCQPDLTKPAIQVFLIDFVDAIAKDRAIVVQKLALFLTEDADIMRLLELYDELFEA